MQHLPFIVLDDAVRAGLVEQLPQLGLTHERALPVALSRCDRVAQQDQQGGQRAQQPGQEPGGSGGGQGDRLGVLLGQGPRRDPCDDVADEDHHRHRQAHLPPTGASITSIPMRVAMAMAEVVHTRRRNSSTLT